MVIGLCRLVASRQPSDCLYLIYFYIENKIVDRLINKKGCKIGDGNETSEKVMMNNLLAVFFSLRLQKPDRHKKKVVK